MGVAPRTLTPLIDSSGCDPVRESLAGRKQQEGMPPTAAAPVPAPTSDRLPPAPGARVLHQVLATVLRRDGGGILKMATPVLGWRLKTSRSGVSKIRVGFGIGEDQGLPLVDGARLLLRSVGIPGGCCSGGFGE